MPGNLRKVEGNPKASQLLLSGQFPLAFSARYWLGHGFRFACRINRTFGVEHIRSLEDLFDTRSKAENHLQN